MTDSSIVCEILAPRAAQAGALAEIATSVARDIGQPVTLKTLKLGPAAGAVPTLTLRLPVALAAAQHQVWCLACRLACCCPSARVSVLVLGAAAFTAKSHRSPARRIRAA